MMYTVSTNSRPPGARNSNRIVSGSAVTAFTLIELLAVIGLMVILMALAVPAFNRIATGSGVDGATRTLTGELRQVRQYAIANRTRTALIVPQTGFSDRNYVAVLACKRNDSGDYVPVPGARWNFFQPGTICYELYADTGTDRRTEGDSVDAAASAPLNNSAMTVTVVTDIDGDGADDTVSNVPALVFRPTGALDTANIHILTIAQGTYDSATSTVNLTNKNNWHEIHVNPFTGRVKVDDS